MPTLKPSYSYCNLVTPTIFCGTLSCPLSGGSLGAWLSCCTYSLREKKAHLLCNLYTYVILLFGYCHCCPHSKCSIVCCSLSTRTCQNKHAASVAQRKLELWIYIVVSNQWPRNISIWISIIARQSLIIKKSSLVLLCSDLQCHYVQ